MAEASVEAATPRDAVEGDDEGDWDGAAEEEVMVLVDLPEYAGFDLFEGARSVEIRVRALCDVMDVELLLLDPSFGLSKDVELDTLRGAEASGCHSIHHRHPLNAHPPLASHTRPHAEPGGAGARRRGRRPRGAGAGRDATVRGAVRGPAGHDAGGGRAGQGRGRGRGRYVGVGSCGCCLCVCGFVWGLSAGWEAKGEKGWLDTTIRSSRPTAR